MDESSLVPRKALSSARVVQRQEKCDLRSRDSLWEWKLLLQFQRSLGLWPLDWLWGLKRSLPRSLGSVVLEVLHLVQDIAGELLLLWRLEGRMAPQVFWNLLSWQRLLPFA